MAPLRIRLAAHAALLALIAAGSSASASPASKATTPAERGHALFIGMGCFQCHGYVGQGGLGAGPALAPNPVGPRAFRTELRTPRAVMPDYSPAILSDGQLDDIYAYLKSIPAGRSPDQIPLLAAPGGKAAFRSTPDRGPGAAIYAANCAGCHGANMEGQVGASLRAESVKRSGRSTLDLIKNPPGGMPRLFPSPLSEEDVAAVAAYIRQGR